MRGAVAGLVLFIGCADSTTLNSSSQVIADPEPQFSITAANFINPIGGDPTTIHLCGSSPDAACTGANDAEIRWGIPAYTTDQSGLGFDVAASAPSAVVYGATFTLGTLTHFNWPTYSGTWAAGASLRLHLLVNPSAGGAAIVDSDIEIPFTIDETPNYTDDVTPCPYPSEAGNPCSDQVTFGTATFALGSSTNTTVYDLRITGFVAPGTSTPVSELISNERNSTSAVLQGFLREHCIDSDDDGTCDEFQCKCDNDWPNHGAYVSCVAHETTEKVREGTLTHEERADIVAAAGKSDCGK